EDGIRDWSVTGVQTCALPILHPAIFEYLIEFRIDSWPNALLVIAIYRYRVRRADALRSSIELAVLSMVAVLCSPKLIMFAALFRSEERRVGEEGRARGLAEEL